ncbi:MAG: redoxin domain-containing protein [Planctomycetota bacterium]
MICRTARSAFRAGLLSVVAALSFCVGCTESGPQDASARPEVETATGDKPLSYRGVDGVEYQPLDTAKNGPTALIFTTVDCPIANGYSPKLASIVTDFAPKGARFFFVHVDPEVTEASAKKHAKDYALKAPVLLDPKHQLVKHAGVKTTPEVALYTKAGELAYRGRIDDWYSQLGKKRQRARTQELRDALAAVLAGKKVTVPRTEAIGCYIPEID